MKVVYYTSGITGSGRIVTGISIGNAFKRNGIHCEYTILSSSRFSYLIDNFKHIEIPAEKENELSEINYHNSLVYNSILKLNPDILIIDLLWAPLYYFLKDFSFKKIFLLHNVSERFFSVDTRRERLVFNPKDYDAIFAIEPVKALYNSNNINPIIIRNKDELLSRDKALKKLNIEDKHPVCLFAYNGEPGEYEAIKRKYSYLADTEYQMIYSTNYSSQSYFPIVDYYNAFDLIICGAGYNQFWEAIYFDKEAIFESLPRRFEDQQKRIDECQEYYFEENGADQLVDIIMNL